jgi:hypothetical protein
MYKVTFQLDCTKEQYAKLWESTNTNGQIRFSAYAHIMSARAIGRYVRLGQEADATGFISELSIPEGK